MPDHVHLLVWPKNGTKISDILKGIKKPVAIRVIYHVKDKASDFLVRMKDERSDGGFSYRFWQRGGGYDRNLWSGKDIWTKIDYIHDNPGRRGLVESPSGWKWISFNAWENDEKGFPRADKDSLSEVFP